MTFSSRLCVALALCASAATAYSQCSVGSTVTLASKTNGLYVTADTTLNNTPLLSEATWSRGWEQYKLVSAGSGYVALQAQSNGKYVSTDLNNGDAIEAGWATAIQGWERFQIVATSDGYYAFKSSASGYYITANAAVGNAPLAANQATAIQDWEKFVCRPASGESPSPLRAKLLNFINSNSGHMTMAGEHNRESSQGNFIQQVHDITGDYPALWGGDFLYESDQISNRQNMINYEISGGKMGAVISLMYHACPPTSAESCGWDPGVIHTSLDANQWSDLVTDGGGLNQVWKSRLDAIAPFFLQIQSAGLPVLFRPFHEENQCVFWWSCHAGSDGTAKLFQLTRDYLTHHWGINNIVWVWSMQDIWDSNTNSYDFNLYDPGTDFWDVMSLDFYDGAGFTQAKYSAMLNYAGNRPIAIGECGKIPTPSELAAQPRWIYFMGWAELAVPPSETTSDLQATYWASDVLTANGNNKMPGW